MAARIFFKLILAVMFLSTVALTSVDFLASKIAERNYVDTLRREMFDKARLISRLSPDAASSAASLARLSGARVTVVAPDGQVLADSEADPSRMENHRRRSELMEALKGREGWSIRPSPTLHVSFLYVAVPIRAGALRLAVPLSKVSEQINAIRKQVLASTALAFLPTIVVAALFARYVSARLGAMIAFAGRLADGDFAARLKKSGQYELGTLAAKLNETGEKLQRTFEQLEREHAELERVERVRKDFMINVSHELRTPLASIQGYTETLLDGAIHEPQHNVGFLKIIRQNAERLGRLVADLLTLSRIELKTQRFQFAHYSLNALLAQHVDAMRPIAEKKAIALDLKPPPSGMEVFCDEEAMHQIVTNLLDNALKYTPEGGSVRVGAHAVGEALIAVTVKDTGMGIPAEDLPRVFERFYRVDKARSRELGGTGLGLAIVKHLVYAQGGEVNVDSLPGEGSTFSFTVPIHDIGMPEIQPVQAELTAS